MRALVVSDVHLKPWMFDRADRILASGQADFAVQLGDLVDDWNQQTNIGKYNQTMARVKRFYEHHPDTLWCMGNHDYGYYHPNMGVRESGHSTLAEPDVREWLSELSQLGWKQELIHIVDNVMFSHAGLTTEWVKRFKLDLAELQKYDNLSGLISSQVNMQIRNPDLLWTEDSPIWARPQFEKKELSLFPSDLLQVVGHTPVMQAEEIDGLLSTDTFSTKRDGTPIGSQQFVIVDTKTKEWHLAEENL